MTPMIQEENPDATATNEIREQQPGATTFTGAGRPVVGHRRGDGASESRTSTSTISRPRRTIEQADPYGVPRYLLHGLREGTRHEAE